jgi:hypothetical protein
LHGLILRGIQAEGDAHAPHTAFARFDPRFGRLVVAACSSATGSPVDTVKEVFRLVEAGQLSKVPDLACAASKDNMAKQFDFARRLMAPPDSVDAGRLAAAVKITTSGLAITEESRTDKAAVVRVKGAVKAAFDPKKFEVTSAAEGDWGFGAWLTSKDQTLDTTADVILDGGAWKICE